jgi:hypothetical protein
MEVCQQLIDQTHDLACCYKPNAAFWQPIVDVQTINLAEILPDKRPIICALSALRLPVEPELSWPSVSSVALHVVESTLCYGFDSFRAHHFNNLAVPRAAW